MTNLVVTPGEATVLPGRKGLGYVRDDRLATSVAAVGFHHGPSKDALKQIMLSVSPLAS